MVTLIEHSTVSYSTNHCKFIHLLNYLQYSMHNTIIYNICLFVLDYKFLLFYILEFDGVNEGACI